MQGLFLCHVHLLVWHPCRPTSQLVLHVGAQLEPLTGCAALSDDQTVDAGRPPAPGMRREPSVSQPISQPPSFRARALEQDAVSSPLHPAGEPPPGHHPFHHAYIASPECLRTRSLSMHLTTCRQCMAVRLKHVFLLMPCCWCRAATCICRASIYLEQSLQRSCMPHQKHHISGPASWMISLRSDKASGKRSHNMMLLQAKPLHRRRSLLP